MKLFFAALLLGVAQAQDYTYSYSQDSTAVTTSIAASSPSSSSSDACAILKVNQDSAGTYKAADVHKCLTAVPFNQADARKFMDKWLYFIQHQTTIGWLKDPPSTYKQPSVDLLKGFNDISAQIDRGYPNLYAFESAMATLIRQGRDFHFRLRFGTTQYWQFGLPFLFTSVSQDGKSVPKVYAFAGAFTPPKLGLLNFDGTMRDIASQSPVKNINSRPVVDYLMEFASNTSSGFLEPHTDWNTLMYTPQWDIQNNLQWYSNFYMGVDQITLELDNGTIISAPVVARWQPAPDPLPADVNDYYRNFILKPKTSTAASQPSETPIADPQPPYATPTGSSAGFNIVRRDQSGSSLLDWSTQYKAFPPSDVGINQTVGASYFTGYYFGDLGVVSLPSFSFSTNGKPEIVAVQAYQKSAQQFIQGAVDRNIKKILIDLRANGGGMTFTGADLFKQLYPNIYPNDHTRWRLNKVANTFGQMAEAVFNSMNGANNDTAKAMFANFQFVPQLAINPVTNTTYNSWREISPGYTQKGDSYSNDVVWDFPDKIVDEFATGGPVGIIVSGFTNLTTKSPANWGPGDIAILTDGYCGSTCAWFADLFRVFGQGKMVVIGGLPQTGPMQAYSGARGNNVLTYDGWNDILQQIAERKPDFPNIDTSGIPSADDVFQINAGVNIRDTLRAGKNWPNQFAYIPADCRMFYTNQTVNDYKTLWLSAANAIWGMSTGVQGSCVDGSTGLKEVTPDDVASATSSGTVPSATARNSAAKVGFESFGSLALIFVAFMLL